MQNTRKPKLIIFEGPDKVGKSTIYQAYRRATNYGPLCIDRFITSNEVYDKFYGREPYADYPTLTKELEGIFDVYQICLVCSEDELVSRIEKEEEGVNLQRAKNNMRRTLHDFQTADSRPQKSYVVDTTNRSVEEVIEELLRITGELDRRATTELENDMTDLTPSEPKTREQRLGQLTIDRDLDEQFNRGGISTIVRKVADLYTDIALDGAVVGKTKELIDVHFDYTLPKKFAPEIDGVAAFFGDRYISRSEDEKFHYDSLKYALLHKVKEVKYFHNQGLDSRKFIVFSQDCISSIQYLVRGNKTKLIVHMRSSDVLGLLPLDILALATILQCLNDEYIPDKPADFEESLSITVGSLHYYLEGGRD